MLITALAAETLLALLSLRASVTLAALLTAILKVQQSAPFAAMTLAMLGMLWRGEAWKAAYLLQVEQQVSEQPQQQQIPTLSNIISADPDRTFRRAEFYLSDRVSQHFGRPLFFEAVEDERAQVAGQHDSEKFSNDTQAVLSCIRDSGHDWEASWNGRR
jgi:hypothetical protein